MWKDVIQSKIFVCSVYMCDLMEWKLQRQNSNSHAKDSDFFCPKNLVNLIPELNLLLMGL